MRKYIKPVHFIAVLAEVEVARPAPQEGIEILHDCGGWLEAFLRPGFFTYRIPRLLQRLL